MREYRHGYPQLLSRFITTKSFSSSVYECHASLRLGGIEQATFYTRKLDN